MPIGNEAWNAEVLSVEGERLWGLQPKWENDENGYLLIPTMHNHDVSAITSRKVFVRLTKTEIPRGSLIKSVFLYLDGRMQYDPADLTPAPKVSITCKLKLFDYNYKNRVRSFSDGGLEEWLDEVHDRWSTVAERTRDMADIFDGGDSIDEAFREDVFAKYLAFELDMPPTVYSSDNGGEDLYMKGLLRGKNLQMMLEFSLSTENAELQDKFRYLQIRFQTPPEYVK